MVYIKVSLEPFSVCSGLDELQDPLIEISWCMLLLDDIIFVDETRD